MGLGQMSLQCRTYIGNLCEPKLALHQSMKLPHVNIVIIIK